MSGRAPADGAERRDRIRAPGMLLVGGDGRESGKTLLATSVLSRLCPAVPVAAAKVTTVHGGVRARPRADSAFHLTEENGLDGTDTGRLREAGGRPVWWLRAPENGLGEGARALVRRIGPETPSIVESTSLGGTLEPGLFAIVVRKDGRAMKASCRRVWELADVVVERDGERLEPPAGDFAIVSGRWTVRRRATAIVLAGGPSTRMGRDKALLSIQGRTLIERVVDQLRPHFRQILVSANDPERYGFLGLEVVPDRRPGLGPMAGVASALARSDHETNLVVPCDVPFQPAGLVRRLLRLSRGPADIIVPVTPEGFHEPLFAVYTRRILPLIERAIHGGERRIVSIFGDCLTVEVPTGGAERLVNVNTAEDYERLVKASTGPAQAFDRPGREA